MKQNRRCTRISILSLLSVSVLLPIFLLSSTLRNFKSEASEEYIEDLSTIKEGESVEGPPLVVYKDGVLGSEVADISSNGSSRSDGSENARISTDIPKRNGTNQDAKQDYQQVQLEKPSLEQSEQATVRGNRNIQATVQGNRNIQALTRRVSDEKVKGIKDQLIRANAYLELAPPGSKSQLVRELRLRIRMLERAVGESSKDSDLSPGALHRMRAMEATLTKASRVYTDCPAMVTKLRAMAYNLEEQARAQKSQVQFLLQVAGRTTPKGLHCLSMRLTAEYFALEPEEWQFPNQQKLHDPDLYHFAVFSDNVLACAVVVNSTISTSRVPEKLVFHIVTDSLNLPAMSMWFLLNPPGKSAMQIQSIDSFEWLSTKYNATLQKENSPDLRYTSALNHLRFYLPDVFPMLNKIVLLDHDVVVQRDLTGLWNISMEGKVNGAVETCQEGEASFRRMDMFVNFSDPRIEKRFDREACTWAFGMNVFDLREWWRHNLTGVYHNYLQLGDERPLWKAGSLPLGWVTFYNHTMALDRTWHVLGLGHDSGVRWVDIEQAAVIHFDGIMKPWLDTGPDKYKEYWRRHVNYGHPYLQQCNIQR
ncbi:hypothetical protein RHGRI_035815 [Rhododendron griersonianum]|uniref:Hexosyltransferase n=1 Tax=Rhododendron griersonianum TaxID=479676 RepID=A0AAV6HP49_9ERIC|nr:hypothetical protein RHGRI_035815 [Rhododendron griersonianum]